MQIDLNDILESIEVESTEDFRLGDFEEAIQAKCPGYNVEVWDCDDYVGTELVNSVAYHICENRNAEDIQFGDWCTLSEDAYFFVVIYK